MQHRQRRLILAYALLLLPTVILEARQALLPHVNSPLSWMPPSSPARQVYDRFTREFGSGDVVIVGWNGCTIDSEALDDLASHLRDHTDFYQNDTWMFDYVVSGRDLIRQLGASGISWEEATASLQGSFVGPDQRTTWVVIGFTERGVHERTRLVEQIRSAITTYCEIPREEQHLAGPIMDGMTVDVASHATVQQLAPASSILVVVAAIVFLRCWRAAVIVFCVAVFSQAITLALISLTGDTVSALLVVLPPLIQVLTLAGSIHLVNYYRQARINHDPADAAAMAIQAGWLPCVLSCATTAIGMASLMISDLAPVRNFGCYAAAGVIMATGVLLFAVPPAIAWGDRQKPRTRSGTAHIWHSFARTISAHYTSITFLFVALVGVGGLGLTRLQTSVRIETLFPPHHQLLGDYRWLESHVGPLVPVEIVVSLKRDAFPQLLHQLDEIAFVESHLAQHPDIRGTLSAARLLPNAWRSALSTTPMPREIAPTPYDRVVQHCLAAWKSMRLLSTPHDGTERWRIRGFVSAVNDADYAALLSDIEQDLGKELAVRHGHGHGLVSLETTGVMPLVHHIQEALMTDLRDSFLLAFAIIAVVMTILQGSIPGGLLAMVPNVFPTCLLFGTLGWLRVPVDIGSVMTASVALGVAVDDTLHFMTAFQRAFAKSQDRAFAVRTAYEECGDAMIQTSFICAIGMVVFATSEFLPTARFAWMMVGLFAAALAGDLVLLPCLLLGPLGVFAANSDGEALQSQEQSTGDANLPASTLTIPHQVNSAASMVSPGPNANNTVGPDALVRPRRSSTNATVGDDMLP